MLPLVVTRRRIPTHSIAPDGGADGASVRTRDRPTWMPQEFEVVGASTAPSSSARVFQMSCGPVAPGMGIPLRVHCTETPAGTSLCTSSMRSPTQVLRLTEPVGIHGAPAAG